MGISSSNCIQYRILQTVVQHVTQAWQAVGRGVRRQITVNEANIEFLGYFDII